MFIYLDDILITSYSERNYLENLAEVLGRLEWDWFKFPAVEYLGHKISDKDL